MLATAVLELYPGVKISIGPPIEDGFYYDFEFPDGVSLSDEDFESIEATMREHVKADERFEREDVTVAEAIERFRGEGQDYKVELIEDLVKHADPDDPVGDGLASLPIASCPAGELFRKKFRSQNDRASN